LFLIRPSRTLIRCSGRLFDHPRTSSMISGWLTPRATYKSRGCTKCLT
jgi:hypothetical protein